VKDHSRFDVAFTKTMTFLLSVCIVAGYLNANHFDAMVITLVHAGLTNHELVEKQPTLQDLVAPPSSHKI
jgi:hypothetical protein